MIRTTSIFIRISLLLAAAVYTLCAHGQQIRVNGRILDEYENGIPNVYIISKSSGQGSFGNPDGSFSVDCGRDETLMFGALGYSPRYVSFADSIPKATYEVFLYLDKKYVRLPEVEVFAPRDLAKIKEDIDKLGYDKNDYMLSGIDAAQSPITFLYQQWSRTERSRRLVAEFENADRKRALLKELFRIYVDWEIIHLSADDFDAFVDYINVSEDFMKHCSQYEFLIFVKERFADFKIWRRNQGLEDIDYEYDRD